MNLQEMIKQLYTIDTLQGYEASDINTVKEQFGALPKVLEEFWSTAGSTQKLHLVQDHWIQPEDIPKKEWLRDSDCLILLDENQGCCQAGIMRQDLCKTDPPVYVTMDGKEWTLCAQAVSGFLQAALCYEAVFAFACQADDFVLWLTEEELGVIQSKLAKKPFELHGWAGMDMCFYSNSYDHMVVVMDCGDLQMIYGAASEKAYNRLMEVLKGIGEA